MLDYKYGGLKIVFITLKKRKKNKKMRKSQTATIIFYLLFFSYIEKFIHILWGNIFGKTVTFLLRFFGVTGYWKCSDKTPTPNALVL